MTTAAAKLASSSDRAFFGHPRGLATLFMTELWERFSFYGMRALLILFMTAPLASGGLGFEIPKASAIYGIYTALVYMAGLPGGWLADRFLGQRRAVLLGGILMACGNFLLAVPNLTVFYVGLGVIICGTGMLKPNVSTMVGQIYSSSDTRRDAGFSIFYMGINLGAFLSPLACGYVGQRINWRWGLAMAGFGMILGIIQYVLGGKNLGEAGLFPAPPKDEADAAAQRRNLRIGLGALIAIVGGLSLIQYSGVGELTAQGISDALGFALLLTVVAFFGWLLFLGDWTPDERKRLVVVGVLFLASCLFWSIFEQAGSTLNLFAAHNTRSEMLGYTFPASWFQSVNSLFIISLAPVFAWLWVKLGRREPSSPAKFALGLLSVGFSFLLLVGGARIAQDGTLVSPWWLVGVYLLTTIGELCLSPVGLSAMTKLAPARIGGLLMGVWFLSISVGNYLGSRVAALYESLPLPALFGVVGSFGVIAALILALFVKPTRRLMGGVR